MFAIPLLTFGSSITAASISTVATYTAAAAVTVMDRGGLTNAGRALTAMNNSNFRVVIFGDLDNEDLVAEIYYKDEFLAELNQGKGFENLEIEIDPPQNNGKWRFNFSELEMALQHARQRLWELRKQSEDEGSKGEGNGKRYVEPS